MIPVTKPYLPPIEKYKRYIDRIYESGILTNRGPLVQELEERLADYLDVKHVICVANGSLALQAAYKALDLKGEVITTPFSFAATSSTLLWESLKPVFCDIDLDSFNLAPELIEQHITENTSAILPVHVFGNPCEIERIQEIADKYKLKVVYDAAHAFGVKYRGESVLRHGDVSTLSFHATKLFHTIEGGAIITECDNTAATVRNLINFGITGLESLEGVGTNAKMNEFEAAMGLCVLDDIDGIVNSRKRTIHEYKKLLGSKFKLQVINPYGSELVSYMPVVFENESELLSIKAKLEDKGIFPRRYFYPSLDVIYGNETKCENSKLLSESILCLPLYTTLEKESVVKVVNNL
ncbi:DegT/DnrJ/EryC1/StrS family aminotransferase [Vibrio sp. A2-1]|uniref:DegT/DnrJ/EryC1/StrS family aminotransferase n=1 Tax=Vibrio sp. A2-1 TaxID=2912252 RepID=UPI001F3BE9CF|nr:DegT/DnrJ/EryC1/StrS family aminotransferase [Vibrio sp. A2-1]MCF7487642.1 DegT/DnrJ/EryC1/StrS family aminotransferase [Vibrio sp. A2-1]